VVWQVPSYAQDTKSTKPAATQPVAKIIIKTGELAVTGTVPKADTAPALVATVSAEPTGQKWWQNLLLIVISGILTIATPILSVLAMSLLKKWNIKVEQQKVDWVLEKAIGYGDQFAKNKLKAGQPVTGPEIMKVALEHGDKLAVQYAPHLGAYLAELIEAKLGQQGMDANNLRNPSNGSQKPA
jgi:hypothetical protein